MGSVYEALKEIDHQSLVWDNCDDFTGDEFAASLSRINRLAREALKAWEPEARLSTDPSPFGEAIRLGVIIPEFRLREAKDPHGIADIVIETLRKQLHEHIDKTPATQGVTAVLHSGGT